MPDHICKGCSTSFYHRKGSRKFCSTDCWFEYQRSHQMPGTFVKGERPVNYLPVGTERIRRRHNRPDGPRMWVKVGEPNRWRLRSVVVWEKHHGLVPKGMVIHHRNRDTLDDSIENLELTTRAEHLLEHRPEFEEKRQVAVRARSRRSTNSVEDE